MSKLYLSNNREKGAAKKRKLVVVVLVCGIRYLDAFAIADLAKPAAFVWAPVVLLAEVAVTCVLVRVCTDITHYVLAGTAPL